MHPGACCEFLPTRRRPDGSLVGRDALCGKTTFKLRPGGGESRDQPGRMGEAGPVKQDERLPRLHGCSGEALRG